MIAAGQPTRPTVGDVVTVPHNGDLVTVNFVAPGAARARYRGEYQLWAALAAGLLLDDLDARELSSAAASIALAELEAAFGPHDPAPVPL